MCPGSPETCSVDRADPKLRYLLAQNMCWDDRKTGMVAHNMGARQVDLSLRPALSRE